jgi:hypothetical protein
VPVIKHVQTVNLSALHGATLLACDGLGEAGLEEALELVLEDLPRRVDAAEAPAAGDDEAPAGEDEHDDGGVLGAVDEAGEHAALERALDVVLLVEEVEVDVLAVEVHVDVADDVLHLDDAAGCEGKFW